MDKFLLEEVDSGKQVEVEVDYQAILNTPACGVLEVGGKKYRKVGRPGNVVRDRPAEKIRKHDVTKRESFCAGVHREQVPEAREFAKDVHPGIEVLHDGSLKFGSRGARAAWLKSQNLRDNDAGYSD